MGGRGGCFRVACCEYSRPGGMGREVREGDTRLVCGTAVQDFTSLHFEAGWPGTLVDGHFAARARATRMRSCGVPKANSSLNALVLIKLIPSNSGG